jgi:siroheme synthase
VGDDVNKLSCGSTVRGRLAIVGSGITAIAHLTMEAIGHIKHADIVFYDSSEEFMG